MSKPGRFHIWMPGLHGNLDVDPQDYVENSHANQHVADHVSKDKDHAKLTCQQIMNWEAPFIDLGEVPRLRLAHLEEDVFEQSIESFSRHAPAGFDLKLAMFPVTQE